MAANDSDVAQIELDISAQPEGLSQCGQVVLFQHHYLVMEGVEPDTFHCDPTAIFGLTERSRQSKERQEMS